MSIELLYQQSGVLIASILSSIMFVGMEFGYRLARKNHLQHNDMTRSQIINIQSAILGLLALLLGFTFSMAMSRFEYRKQMVVQESNAIGTASLRSTFLPDSREKEVNKLFRRYVKIRLDSVFQTEQKSPEREILDLEVRNIQQQLWLMASESSVVTPHSIPLGLFTHAVNEMIDIKMKRDIAVANHVPESVIFLLLALAILTAIILGYGSGLAGLRIISMNVIYCFFVVLVIMFIIDLDHPQEGLSQTSQQSMIQLKEILDTFKGNGS